MKTAFTGLRTGLAVAALLIAGSSLPSYAEDAATPPAAQTPAATTDAPPAAVARPSLVPKTAEPAQPSADAAPPPRHRRYAHYRHRHWGNYRTAYWEPFPIFWPHVYHNRIHWNRIPWMFRF